MSQEKSNETTVLDRHNAQYEAYLKLGPYCPKCKELAKGFYIDFNPLRGMFMGKVDCDKCKKTHRMIYKDSEWVFDEDREFCSTCGRTKKKKKTRYG
jgi:hypothetical protein